MYNDGGIAAGGGGGGGNRRGGGGGVRVFTNTQYSWCLFMCVLLMNEMIMHNNGVDCFFADDDSVPAAGEKQSTAPTEWASKSVTDQYVDAMIDVRAMLSRMRSRVLFVPARQWNECQSVLHVLDAHYCRYKRESMF